MSILVVHLVPQGLIFCADRNITATRTRGVVMLRGQTQRPKVLKWPNRDVIVGYVGQARIGTLETDEWLYAFLGRNLIFPDFRTLAAALTDDLNAAMQAGDITEDVTLHLGGFEQVSGEWTPRVWFIRNTTQLTPTGPILGPRFVGSEEIAQPAYFGGKSGNQIRLEVANAVNGGGLFSFRQGYDLAAFNAIDQGLRAAMQAIVQSHPLAVHPFPSSLEEWAKHVRMSVLGYSAYFGAFYAAYEQYVGGGADVVAVPWP